MILFINNKGKFLVVNEVSTRTTQITMEYYWMNDINRASLFPSKEAFNRTIWKLDSPRSEIHSSMIAEENVIRTVTLVKAMQT